MEVLEPASAALEVGEAWLAEAEVTAAPRFAAGAPVEPEPAETV